MQRKNLTWYCENPDYFMITAHRGASYEFPENTLMAMEKAIECGVDMVEFDVTHTRDGVPVILHDTTIDRTSNGKGSPKDMDLAELKKLNFSLWLQKEKRTTPAYQDVTIPTLEEILDAFGKTANMNIQLHDDVDDSDALKKICGLFAKYDMFDHAYLTVGTRLADSARAINPEIELCVTPPMPQRSLPENIIMCREKYGCRFIQPVKEYTDAAAFALIRQTGLRGNVFFTDDPQEMEKLREIGATGIMTNKAALMCLNRK